MSPEYRQGEFFRGADYAWDGPKGSGKMPFAVFDRAAQWHGTTSEWGMPDHIEEDEAEDWYPQDEFEEYDNWEDAQMMSEEFPPIHSGTPHSALDRAGRSGHFYPVVPLNVATDEDGDPELFDDDEANLMDANYRAENYLPRSSDHGWLPPNPSVEEDNPLLEGKSVRYLNRHEGKGSSSYVSPPEQLLTLNDHRVDRGLARSRYQHVRPYQTGAELQQMTGASDLNHPSMHKRSIANQRVADRAPQMFKRNPYTREERLNPDISRTEP